MKNNEATQEWVLSELRKVQEWYQNRKANALGVNVHQMAKDAADVIEDLQNQNEILRKEKSDWETEGEIPEKKYVLVYGGDGSITRMDYPEERIPELDELGGLSKREEALQRFVACASTKPTQEVEAILGVGQVIVDDPMVILEKMRAELREDINE